jgi:hypothetical protein
MRTTLESNTEMTKDIYDIATNLKGFAKTLGWVGSGFLFVGKFVVVPIAFVGGGIYAVFHGGHFPAWFTEMVKALFA